MEIESVQRAIKQLKQIQITQLYHSVASFLVGASLDHKAKNIIQRLTINCESLTLVQAVSPQTLIAQLTRIFKFTFFHVVQISLVSMAHPTCSKSVKTTCLDFSSPFLSLCPEVPPVLPAQILFMQLFITQIIAIQLHPVYIYPTNHTLAYIQCTYFPLRDSSFSRLIVALIKINGIILDISIDQWFIKM